MMRYEINGTIYHQRELVLGQIQQLLAELAGVGFTDTSVPGVIAALGDRIYRAVAVVLIPDGVAIRDRDLTAIADDLENAPARVLLQVVADFFDCNQLSSLLETLETLTDRIDQAIGTRSKQ
jgi:hypothetical protein